MSMMRVYDWQRAVVGLCLAGWLSACVETKISVRLQKDGTGEAAVEQFIPAMLLDGKMNGTQVFSIEKNNLLFRSEKEAQELLGSRRGLKILNFETKDIKPNPDPTARMPATGGRATRTLVSFENIESLDTEHFNFAIIPDGSDQYFVFRVGKTLHETYLDKSNGGMGPILASALAGRFLTVYVELPSRALASNATSSQWNVVEWKIPLGSVYNLVQDEILGWAKLSGTQGLTLGKVREAVVQNLPGNEWRKPKNFAPYFLLPAEEPPPRPRNKGSSAPVQLGSER